MKNWGEIFENYISKIAVPRIGVIDIIEILLISFFVYEFMVWIKNTRAYTLLKGIVFVLMFVLAAYVFRMNTILWIVEKMATVMITAVFIIFQPELRRILEQLGEKNLVFSIFNFDSGRDVEERFTDRTVSEIARACFDMGAKLTGALIVIEQNVVLTEYEKTGIALDSLVSSQLLINIFEHNTPLHDGAVIVRGNRIVAATCYLPLSDNRELSKQLGTRHRAGVGISEVSDSLTIIVSEETGGVSMAQGGTLRRHVTLEELTEAMRGEMHKLWGEDMLVTSNYGMSELMGPGVSGECEYLCGMHINEDYFIPEIINPKTGEVLPPGEKGELVITCIYKEALPLIRYRTKDITRLIYEPCKCGRTTVRMENLSGRTDDMLKIRGVNVFPSQIEEVLLGIEEIGPHYEIIVTRKNHSDLLEIRVELVKPVDVYRELEALEKKIKHKLRIVLGLDAKIRLESPNTLKRFEGKAQRVKDLRKEV